jgi:asparagine synthase (glutamine-hydrolysing)
MCGLTGIFNFNGQPTSLHIIRQMTRAIAHRGPDGDGFFVEENIAFGHQRLAILDTSPKGAQPMLSKNGEWVVVFNGCIYNFYP